MGELSGTAGGPSPKMGEESRARPPAAMSFPSFCFASMKCRRSVKNYWMFSNNKFKCIPNCIGFFFN